MLEASANNAVKQNATWLRNLHEPLIEMGHDVHLFSPDIFWDRRVALAQFPREKFTQALIDDFRIQHGKRPFDMAFFYVKAPMLAAAALDVFRTAGVPTCNFSCNNTHQFDLVAPIAKAFDLNLYAEKAAGRKFEQIGASALWWPMACNPAYFKPIDVQRDVSASFVGAPYALRASYIRALLERGQRVDVWGPGWRAGTLRRELRDLTKSAVAFLRRRSQTNGRWNEHVWRECRDLQTLRLRFPSALHMPCSDSDAIRLYSRSLVSLGFLEVVADGKIDTHLHLREFEAPMCGALYITGYSEELAEMFTPEVEVITYRGVDELSDKVAFFAANERAGLKVRMSARRRALEEHTYHSRFKVLFGALGL